LIDSYNGGGILHRSYKRRLPPAFIKTPSHTFPPYIFWQLQSDEANLCSYKALRTLPWVRGAGERGGGRGETLISRETASKLGKQQ
jgi:hypothetical protein